MRNLDPEPYWVEESQNRYHWMDVMADEMLWNVAVFDPRPEYSQDEKDYR